VLVVSKDVGVGEFYQLYTLEAGALTLLTDGRSRNEGATWDREGNRLAYTSTRRNGTDSDIYIVDPRDPKSDRMVVSVKGNGWAMSAFAPGGKKAIVERYFSVEKSELYEFDIASGKMTRLMPECVTVAWSGATYGPDGTIYVRCDQGSDFKRLGKLANGAFVALNPETNWDIEDFAVAEDGSFIAYEINEAGCRDFCCSIRSRGGCARRNCLPAFSAGPRSRHGGRSLLPSARRSRRATPTASIRRRSRCGGGRRAKPAVSTRCRTRCPNWCRPAASMGSRFRAFCIAQTQRNCPASDP